MIPTGNYLVFKYHNNFIVRDSTGVIINMNDDIVNNLFLNAITIGEILGYNFALLIKLDDDFNPDDTFFVNNTNMYTILNVYLICSLLYCL